MTVQKTTLPSGSECVKTANPVYVVLFFIITLQCLSLAPKKPWLPNPQPTEVPLLMLETSSRCVNVSGMIFRAPVIFLHIIFI